MSDDTKDPKNDSKATPDESKAEIVQSEQKPQADPATEKPAQIKIPKMDKPGEKSSDNLFNANPAPKLQAPKTRSGFRPLSMIALILSVSE